MKEYQSLLVDKNDGIATVTVNRPSSLNALNKVVLSELQQVFEELENDLEVLAVIITGSGNKSFVAGADITELQKLSALEARDSSILGQSVFSRIENLSKPVIAAVNGYALGGGCELAMSCDIRIASETAKFGLPELRLGVIPGYAGTQRLPRLIGKGHAKTLILTGDQIDAQEAYRIGLVSKVVASDVLIESAKELAVKIASNGRVAVKFAKSAINKGMDMDFESGQAYESEIFGLCFATEDQREGMTAFVEKRKANFVGK